MKNKKSDKIIDVFNTLYVIGAFFAFTKMMAYLQWTFQLIRKWKLPNEPFFSKVVIPESNTEISITMYLSLASAYILAFGFVIFGLYTFHKTKKFFTEEKYFQKEISTIFSKVGTHFISYVFVILFIDICFLFWTKTSSKVVNLLSTELLLFLVLGLLMFFISEIFKKVAILKEDNKKVISSS